MVYTSLGGLFLLHQLLEVSDLHIIRWTVSEVSGLHIIRWGVFIASTIGGEWSTHH